MNNRRKIRSFFSKFSLSTVKVLFQLKNNFVDADYSRFRLTRLLYFMERRFPQLRYAVERGRRTSGGIARFLLLPPFSPPFLLSLGWCFPLGPDVSMERKKSVEATGNTHLLP